MEPFLRGERFELMYLLLQHEPKIHTRAGNECACSSKRSIGWLGAEPTGACCPRTMARGTSVYKRFARWDDLGVRACLFRRVADDPDLPSVTIDATVVRAHACATGAPPKTEIRRRKG